MSKYFLSIFIGGLLFWASDSKGQDTLRQWEDGSYATSIYVVGDDVYVGGEQGNENGVAVAKLWKNGVAQNLTDGSSHARVHSVFVAGNDVYVAGSEESKVSYLELGSDLRIASRVACLWKNGILQNLNIDKSKYSEANSVFVLDGNVYVVGSYDGAKLWKNGVIYSLDGYTASSVFISGNDVYVAGYEVSEASDSIMTGPRSTIMSPPIARLWKNGIVQNLNLKSKYSKANSVFVLGSDVYVAGVEFLKSDYWRETAVLWKNGVAQYLNFDSADSIRGNQVGVAHSVFVSENGDVYVGGYVGYVDWVKFDFINYPVLWKNGVAQKLSGGDTRLGFGIDRSNTPVFVSGEDVYVAGSTGNFLNSNFIAAIWKNGNVMELIKKK